MPNAIGPLDPNLRQQLAAMLSGDAKAGSIRAQLVHGLLGSQTGDDSGLVGMTPLGAAFDVDAAHRDQRQGGTGAGHLLSAAAGMIPGAGPEIKAGSAAAHSLASDFVWALAHKAGLLDDAVKNPAVSNSLYELAAKHGISPEHLSDDGLDELSESLMKQHSGQELLDLQKQHGITPQDIIDSHTATGVKNTKAQTEAAYEQSRMPKVSGVRAQLEAASRDNDKGATNVINPPTPAGTSVSISKATKPAPVKVSDIDNPLSEKGSARAADMEATDLRQGMDEENHIKQVAGGDAKKLNFIRNAMMDEGGNVPEDVAMTLIDHLQQKNPARLKELMNDHEIISSRAQHGTDLNPQAIEALTNSLAQAHSIPEMLAMHYDLNPELLSKAYKMPGPRTKPTQ